MPDRAGAGEGAADRANRAARQFGWTAGMTSTHMLAFIVGGVFGSHRFYPGLALVGLVGTVTVLITWPLWAEMRKVADG